jgi:hypothetical protein
VVFLAYKYEANVVLATLADGEILLLAVVPIAAYKSNVLP